MLDLNLMTLSLEAGQEQRDMPGLYAVAPKKAARLRASDRLILQMSQIPAAPAPSYSPLPPNLQQELLSRLAETYFTSTGSVTAGMKSMAERLNDFLINRNLRQSRQQAAQVIGMLNMAVVHGSFLYIAQAGPVHTYVVQGGRAEHFTDSGGPARGLGLARAINLRFFQTSVEAGANLVLCSDPSPEWNEAVLAQAAGLELAAMRAALKGEALNLDCVLVRLSEGRGEVKVQPVSLETPAGPMKEAPTAAPVPTIEAGPQGVYLSGKPLGEVSIKQPSGDAGKAAEIASAVEATQPRPTPVVALSGEPGNVSLTSQEEPVPAVSSLETTADQPILTPVVPVEEPDLPAEAQIVTSQDSPPWEQPLAPEVVGTHPEPPSTSQVEIQPVDRLGGAERARQRAAQRAAEETHRREKQTGEVAAPPMPEDLPAPEPDEPVAAASQAPARRTRPQPEAPSAAAAGAAHAANAFIAGMRKLRGWFGGAFSRMAARTMPNQPTEGVRLSSSTMIAIAVFVPILVVAVSATVYFQRGRGQIHAAAVHTAQQFANRAETQDDNGLRREDLNQAVAWLDRAETYGESQESIALRSRVQAGLDKMEGITRLSFRPALDGTLGEGVQVKRMVSVVNDVYLLDAVTGRVLRAYRSGTGYEIDPSFMCEPGEFGGGTLTVGPLVDITTLPSDNFVHATILGLDAQGHALLCQSGEIPSALTLEPPDMNWGTLARAVHLQGVLYVLDTQVNQVYRYFYNDSEKTFVGKPGIYFDLQVPRLGDVVDLAADEEYLYLLHADGSMTSCNSSGANTQCDDPAPYGDSREGKPSDPLKFDGASFTLMQSTQPPDPSLYVLDVQGPSIYNFSHRRLNLQRIYQPEIGTGFPPAGKAPQSMVVTPNRRVLLAVDDQLYMVTLP